MQRKIFIFVFFVLALLPIAQMTLHVFAETQVNENRTLAPLPRFDSNIYQLPGRINNWFNDHFGLRPFLIRLKAQIDYSVFRTSDRVLVGKNGWLFYRSTVNVEEPAVEVFLRDKLPDVVRGMKAFSDALAAKNIKVILIINMMSDRFYGDMLPPSAVHRPPHARIDDLVTEMRALPNIHFVDSDLLLRQAMMSRPVFHKTDFHWNDPGAFPVAEAIVNEISKGEGLKESVWKHGLEIEYRKQSGGIAMFMPLFIPPSEQALMVKPNFTWPGELTQSPSPAPFETVLTFPDEKGALLPPVVFVGDSFLDGLLHAGIQAYFQESRRIRWRADLRFSDIAKAIPLNTRWCVIQFIEVSLAALNALQDSEDVAEAVAIIEQRWPANP